MEIAVVTTKGRIVVPSRIRKKLGIKKGTKIGFIECDGKLIIQPLKKRYFLSMAGILGTNGDMLKALMEDKRRERKF
ncbi:MAG: AbrB/MazE/SpoVT family DNA-binding domain-containing protein [Candidatus Kryptoniota bacterium]